MFGTIHIISLFVCSALIVVGTIYSLKLSFELCTRIMLGVGIVSEFLKVFTYIMWNEAELGGYLPKTDLPFHLCSIQIIFLIVLVLSKNGNTKRILRSFMLPTCLIGGFAALMIPIGSATNELTVITFQYFGYHSAIMIFALRMLVGKDVEFTVSDYGTCLLLLVVTLFGAIYINSILYNGVGNTNFFHDVTDGENIGRIQLSNVNFMYVVNPPAEGLPVLNEEHGWLVYMVHYMWVCLFSITAVYSGPIARFFKSLKKKKSA